MKIPFKGKLFIILFLLVLLIVPQVFAASSNFLQRANQAYQRLCTGRSVPLTIVMSCYAFDKLAELQQAINLLDERLGLTERDNATQSAKIKELEERIMNLEPPNPSPSSSPTTIVFAQNRPASFTTDLVAIPNGYTSMTFHVSTTGTLINWAPIANVNSFVNEQHRFRCNNNICPDVTIPIISGFYKFGTGTSSGNITAIATLNAEPDNSTQVLGYGVNLPFTSGPI